MRIQKWQLPRNKWVLNDETGKWYSRPRTQMDIIMMRSAISAMTFMPYDGIVWIPQQHHFVVTRS